VDARLGPLRTAIERARTTRGALADALHRAERTILRSARGPEIAYRATVAIGALYEVEVSDPSRMEQGLAEAHGILTHLLADLERDPGAAPIELIAAVAWAVATLGAR
jgi:hypothetical protein